MNTPAHPDVTALRDDEVTALRTTLAWIAQHCDLVPAHDAVSPAQVDRYAAVLRAAFPAARTVRTTDGLAIVRPLTTKEEQA